MTVDTAIECLCFNNPAAKQFWLLGKLCLQDVSGPLPIGSGRAKQGRRERPAPLRDDAILFRCGQPESMVPALSTAKGGLQTGAGRC